MKTEQDTLALVPTDQKGLPNLNNPPMVEADNQDRLNDADDADDADSENQVDLTAEIENSMVALSMEDTLDMPFVKPHGDYLVGSVLQRRRFISSALENLMIDILWNPIHEVQMKELEQNLFLFGFAHQVDLQKVIREGPWRFNRHMLLLEEIAEPEEASRKILTKIPIWIQVADVPRAWLTVSAAKAIGEKLGRVLEVDPDSAGARGLGFLRV